MQRRPEVEPELLDDARLLLFLAASLWDGQQTFLQLRPICMKRGAIGMRREPLAGLLHRPAPGAGFSTDGAVRKEQCALRSCRDAARDSAMCPMASRAVGMAQAAFQQCSITSGRCPSISDISPGSCCIRQKLHSRTCLGQRKGREAPSWLLEGSMGAWSNLCQRMPAPTLSWYRKNPCRDKAA